MIDIIVPKDRSTSRVVSPFVPGAGASPPVLAGRESHKNRLEGLCLRLVETRLGAHRPAVLIGPRGNGKTVLLGWLEEQAKGMDIDTLWVTPDEIPTLDALAEKLGATQGGSLEKVRLSGHAGEIGGAADVQFRDTRRHAPPDLTAILRERAKRSPFALLVDEAHTLDIGVGRALMNAAQRASNLAPFLLTMAGTPDLRDVLSEMSATFWGRALKVGVGLLSAGAVVTAIADPLKWSGIGLEDEKAWERVVIDSQGYPYFVQTWGEELWRQGGVLREIDQPRSGDSRIVLPDSEVEAAGVRVSAIKNDYYGDRYEELGKVGLLSPARAVAEAFVASEQPAAFSWETLTDIAQDVIASDQPAGEVLRGLSHVGFIWRSPDGNDWGPGIPSLMSYVLDRGARQDNELQGPSGP